MVRESNLYSASYLRNFVFGVEDSLVSTVGLLSGVSIAGMGARAILITGIILVFVEAFSMAVGSFLSEHSAEGYLRQTEAPFAPPIISGSIMFVSYFFSGLIPLSPYVFLISGIAFWYSIGLSLAALFVLGIIGAELSKTNIWKGGFRMALVGGIAIAVGVVIGQVAAAF